MVASVNYFELYPGDYLRDTGELSLIQHGAFLLLMASCYSTEKGLPSEPMGLFRITSALTPEEQEATLFVANRFFKLCDDGRLRSERIDEDIQKAKVRIEAAKANGAKGGRPPKAKQNPDETGNKPNGFPLGSNPVKQNETELKAHQTPPTITTSEIDTPAGPTPAGEAAVAMRNAGCMTINQSNVDFLAALAEGVTPKELADAVAAYRAEIPGGGLFTYAVKVARTNHAKSAAVIQHPAARAGPAAPAQSSKTRQSVQNMQDTANALIEQSTAALGYQGNQYGPDEAAHAQLGWASGA